MVITKQQISQKHGNYIAQQKYPGYMVVTQHNKNIPVTWQLQNNRYPRNMVTTQHNKNILVTW